MNAAAADPRAAALSHLSQAIKRLRKPTNKHKEYLRLAVLEHLTLTPDADVPVLDASTALDFVRRLPRRLHCRA